MRMRMMMMMVGDWLSVAGGSQIASSRSSSAKLQPPHCRLSCRLADEIYLMQHDGVWGEFAMGSVPQRLMRSGTKHCVIRKRIALCLCHRLLARQSLRGLVCDGSFAAALLVLLLYCCSFAAAPLPLSAARQQPLATRRPHPATHCRPPLADVPTKGCTRGQGRRLHI